jgi:hypothetical protein
MAHQRGFMVGERDGSMAGWLQGTELGTITGEQAVGDLAFELGVSQRFDGAVVGSIVVSLAQTLNGEHFRYAYQPALSSAAASVVPEPAEVGVSLMILLPLLSWRGSRES